jgi:hypothetical protein
LLPKWHQVCSQQCVAERRGVVSNPLIIRQIRKKLFPAKVGVVLPAGKCWVDECDVIVPGRVKNASDTDFDVVRHAADADESHMIA